MKRLLRLLSLCRPLYPWMALGVLLSLLTVLANVTLMAVSGWFITSMAVAGAAQISMNYFTPAAIIRGSAILRTGGRYAERLVTHEATLQLLSRLRAWFYERLEPLAPAALQGQDSGDLLSRIGADIDTLNNLYLRLLVPAVTALLATIMLTLFLATYDLRLAAVLLIALVAAGVAVPLIVQGLGRAPGMRKISLLAQQRGMLVDSTRGLGELLLYDAAPAYRQRLTDNSRELARAQASLSTTGGLSRAAPFFCANLAMLTVLVLSIPMVTQGMIEKADLAMLALFCLAAFEVVLPIPLALQAYGETSAAAERLFDIIDREPPVRSPDAPAPVPDRFDLRLAGVTFAYPGAKEPVLQNLDLEIPHGSRLTLRGASGSGKSTIVQLLLRFYDPQQGRVAMGGVPLPAWDVEQLRRHLAVASQQAHLFTGTIRHNLLIARPDATPSELEDACRIAQVHDFIAALPEGYDTWVGEAGTTLSGGQIRRLSIARALLKDCPVLILDEPTEGLDPTTAERLLTAIEAATQGKTVLLISHQPQVAFRSDRESILVAGTPAPVRNTNRESLPSR
jgi:ATP-binding cassette subfamily C protein CydC